jgi:hypothetical protein
MIRLTKLFHTICHTHHKLWEVPRARVERSGRVPAEFLRRTAEAFAGDFEVMCVSRLTRPACHAKIISFGGPL